jgi:hypothetical protein
MAKRIDHDHDNDNEEERRHEANKRVVWTSYRRPHTPPFGKTDNEQTTAHARRAISVDQRLCR